MNRKAILSALELIEDNAEDNADTQNAIAVIRCEVNKEPGGQPVQFAPVPASPALDPEKFLATSFEAGKQYIVFMESGAVDRTALESLVGADYGLIFVFVHPDGRPVAEKFLVVEKGARIFADSRYMEAMDGVTMVDPGSRELRDVVVKL